MATPYDQENNSNRNYYRDNAFHVFYVPPPARKKSTIFKNFFYERKLLSIIFSLIALISIERLWSYFDYSGLAEIAAWSHEIAATILLILAVFLFREFRQWHCERSLRKEFKSQIKNNIQMIQPESFSGPKSELSPAPEISSISAEVFFQTKMELDALMDDDWTKDIFFIDIPSPQSLSDKLRWPGKEEDL